MSVQDFEAHNVLDMNGNPSGGSFNSAGIQIDWQDGPLKNEDGTFNAATGAFVDTVIAAAIQRLQFFQLAAKGKFRCPENASAIKFLEDGLTRLQDRTRLRSDRGVEGTHTP